MKKRTVIKKFRAVPQRGTFGKHEDGRTNYRDYTITRASNAEQVIEEAKKELERWQNNRNRLARVEYELEFGYGVVRLVRIEQISEATVIHRLKFSY